MILKHSQYFDGQLPKFLITAFEPRFALFYSDWGPMFSCANLLRRIERWHQAEKHCNNCVQGEKIASEVITKIGKMEGKCGGKMWRENGVQCEF
jgi:hypothetical protein